MPQNLDASALLGLWSWAGSNRVPFLLSGASPTGSVSSPQHTKAWSRARDHPRHPSRSRRTRGQRKIWRFHSYGLVGKRSDSPRLSWSGAPGPRAGVGGGWVGPVKCPQAPNSFLYGKILEKLNNLIHLIHVIILPQKTQSWTTHLWTNLPWWMWGHRPKNASQIRSSEPGDCFLGKNTYFNLKQGQNNAS